MTHKQQSIIPAIVLVIILILALLSWWASSALIGNLQKTPAINDANLKLANALRNYSMWIVILPILAAILGWLFSMRNANKSKDALVHGTDDIWSCETLPY